MFTCRGAERKSDASIVGKALKYGSATVAAVGHLAAISGSVYIYRNQESLKEKVEALESAAGMMYSAKNFGKMVLNFFGFNDEEKEKEKEKNVKEILSTVKSWIPNKLILIMNSLALLVDIACYDFYRLGQCMDGDSKKPNENQEKKSSKEIVLDKNKSSNPKDKNQNLHEDSKKSKV